MPLYLCQVSHPMHPQIMAASYASYIGDLGCRRQLFYPAHPRHCVHPVLTPPPVNPVTMCTTSSSSTIDPMTTSPRPRRRRLCGRRINVVGERTMSGGSSHHAPPTDCLDWLQWLQPPIFLARLWQSPVPVLIPSSSPLLCTTLDMSRLRSRLAVLCRAILRCLL